MLTFYDLFARQGINVNNLPIVRRILVIRSEHGQVIVVGSIVDQFCIIVTKSLNTPHLECWNEVECCNRRVIIGDIVGIVVLIRSVVVGRVYNPALQLQNDEEGSYKSQSQRNKPTTHCSIADPSFVANL